MLFRFFAAGFSLLLLFLYFVLYRRYRCDWKTCCRESIKPCRKSPLVRFIDVPEYWVRRRTVIVFATFEFVLCLVVATIYVDHPEVAEMGWGIKSANAYMFTAVFRGMAGLLGLHAAWRRRVRISKVYLIILVHNFMWTFLAIVPFVRCDCTCQGWNPEDIQCRILYSFTDDGNCGKECVNRDRALHKFEFAEPGIRWELMASSAEPRNCRVMNASGSRNHAEYLHMRAVLRRAFKDYIGCSFDHDDDQKPNLKQNQYKFDDKEVDAHLRDLLICGRHISISNQYVKFLYRRLRKCFDEPMCAVLEVHDDYPELRLCQQHYPVLPKLSSKDYNQVRKKGSNCLRRTWLVKNVASVVRHKSKKGQGAANSWCLFTVTAVFLLLGVLNTLSIPMAIIIYRFISNRCGDGIEIVSQFSVRTEMSDDDFDVRSVGVRSDHSRTAGFIELSRTALSNLSAGQKRGNAVEFDSYTPH